MSDDIECLQRIIVILVPSHIISRKKCSPCSPLPVPETQIKWSTTEFSTKKTFFVGNNKLSVFPPSVKLVRFAPRDRVRWTTSPTPHYTATYRTSNWKYESTSSYQGIRLITPSTNGIFRCCPSLPKEHVELTDALANKYKPIECDLSLSIEERKRHMDEWYVATEESLRGIVISPEEISDIAEKYGPCLRYFTSVEGINFLLHPNVEEIHHVDALRNAYDNFLPSRDGSKKVFQLLEEKEVPVLVFSAGLGDTVAALLTHNGIYRSNVKVVSNFLDFGEHNVVQGFRGKLIHIYSKNEHALEGTDYFDVISKRNNVILMGDSIGDAGMADGLPDTNAVLKIGFLYYEMAEKKLSDYLNYFDIVLEDDQTMDVLTSILELLK